MKSGGLFAGYGGLDMAIAEVFGSEPAWFSEFEPPTEKNPNPSQAAAKILAHHWPAVPNLGDITQINWDTVKPVAILGGGFPCQDVSLAGKRAGLAAGTRSGLWAHFALGISKIRPRYVVVENVRGLLSAEAHSDVEPCSWCLGDGPGEPALRALGAVLADLADLGYDVQWCGLRAADVGAPHGRYRIFVLATNTADDDRDGRSRDGTSGRWSRGSLGDTQSSGRDDARPALRGGKPTRAARGSGLAVADAGNDGREWGAQPGSGGQALAGLAGDVASDANHPRPQGTESTAGLNLPARRAASHTAGYGRHEGRTEPARQLGGSDASERGAGPAAWGQYADAIRRWERVLGRPAPLPTELTAKGSQRLSPAFVEWMMGLPAGHVTDVPGVNRNAQLKALGNGVVPQQAAAALRYMLANQTRQTIGRVPA